MIIVGHRGAAGYAPENTLLSFQTALELGCPKIELDVHVSKDGEIIVIHDETVDRTTNGHGFVKEKTLAELKLLKCAQDQQIPTLQEVIDLCKGKAQIIIELKGQDTAKPVNNLLLKNNFVPQVLIISFSKTLLWQMRGVNSEVQMGYLFSRWWQKFGLWNFAKLLSLNYICPRVNLISKNFVEKAHKKNLKVFSWTVNTKEVGAEMEKLNVDEIGTDYPKLFF